MIIALCGLTSTGKSTVAKIIAGLIDAKIRHCGDIVKERARDLNLLPDELPIFIHNEIDEQTKNLVENTHETLVVEGRYLAEVLHGISDVLLFELSCSDDERKDRFSSRNKHNASDLATIENQDAITVKLRTKLYGDIQTICANLVKIDTTGQTPLQVADTILYYAKSSAKDEA